MSLFASLYVFVKRQKSECDDLQIDNNNERKTEESRIMSNYGSKPTNK